MTITAKIATNSKLLNDIAQEMSDPVWQQGFLDGQLAQRESAPDMARGHRYALGWITGRYHHYLAAIPPSSAIH